MRPAHFFFGEESYLAWMFIEKIQESLAPEDRDQPGLERFRLGSHAWRDVLDSARTGSLLFPAQRLLVVESPPRRIDYVPSPHEELSAGDKKAIQDYLRDPPPDTSLIIIFPGRIRRSSPLVKFFSSFASAVEVTEMKPLKGRKLGDWLAGRFQAEGYTATPEAVARLIDLVGGDLRLLDMEVKKLITFAGEKRRVELDEVDQVSGWIRSYVEWELANQLEQGNYKQCLLVVQNLKRKEDVRDTQILALVTNFFRNLMLVKLRLEEGQKSRKQIFSEVKPQIKENFRSLYDAQFQQVFSLAEAFTLEDLGYILSRLSEVDLKLKSSSLSFQALLEAFLFEYCWMKKYGRAG